MKNYSNLIILISIFSLTIFSGCKKEGCTDENANNYDAKAKKDDGSCTYNIANLTIEFGHSVDDAALELNQRIYLSEAGNKYSVETLKYFISDITIKGTSGTQDVFLDTVHYIDVSNINTLSISFNEVLKVGYYSGMTFIFGLTDEKNISSRYPDEPKSLMAWPNMMGGGYHFMKLEGKYDSLETGTIKNYLTHTGRLEMMGMEKHNNHFTVSISKDFSINGETSATANVNMNINNWYVNPTTYDFNLYDAGIMNNQTAQDIIKNNGVDVFELKSVDVN
jgi:hypothetical protein